MNNKEINKYIRSDLYRYEGATGLIPFLKCYLRNVTFRFQVALRLRQGKGLYVFLGCVLWGLRREVRQRIQLHPNTKIGYGLFIGHGGPVVVNPTAVLGNNVNLSQFVTIVANFTKAATIGDNTYIGLITCIIDNVKIGNNVTIGAGSVVTKDIPDNATAVGNYAKVINYDNRGNIQKTTVGL